MLETEAQKQLTYRERARVRLERLREESKASNESERRFRIRSDAYREALGLTEEELQEAGRLTQDYATPYLDDITVRDRALSIWIVIVAEAKDDRFTYTFAAMDTYRPKGNLIGILPPDYEPLEDDWHEHLVTVLSSR